MSNCSFCGAKCQGEYCFRHKPRKPLQAKHPMKKVGRVTREVMAAVEDWKAGLKPPYRCAYCLYLGIDIPLEIEYLQAEHTQSKARHPGLRLVKSKWVLSCSGHNAMKKSLDIEDFLKILDKEIANARNQSRGY